MSDDRFRRRPTPPDPLPGPQGAPPPEPEPAAEPSSLGDGPLPERRRSPLLTDDLSRRRGNYILTFGYPQSGKTTFHSFLIRYLMEEGPFSTKFMNRNDDGDVDFDVNRMIDVWRKEWREGRFPKPTPVGEEQIRELSFEVRPLTGVRTPLRFSFLEVSGEMLQTVMPSETQDPSLSRVLRELLENQNIRFIILLLINPDVYDNDELFTNFLNYLDNNLGFNIRERASLGIVISKPEEALEALKRLRRGYGGVHELRGEICEDFVEHFAPSSYREWYDWPNPKRKMISRFYLGKIESDGSEPRLVSPDFTSTRNIFAWIYHQATNERLGPGRWRRLLNWFRT